MEAATLKSKALQELKENISETPSMRNLPLLGGEADDGTILLYLRASDFRVAEALNLLEKEKGLQWIKEKLCSLKEKISETPSIRNLPLLGGEADSALLMYLRASDFRVAYALNLLEKALIKEKPCSFKVKGGEAHGVLFMYLRASDFPADHALNFLEKERGLQWIKVKLCSLKEKISETPSMRNLPLLGGEADGVLLMYLRASDFRVADALNLLEKALQWIKEKQKPCEADCVLLEFLRVVLCASDHASNHNYPARKNSVPWYLRILSSMCSPFLTHRKKTNKFIRPEDVRVQYGGRETEHTNRRDHNPGQVRAQCGGKLHHCCGKVRKMEEAIHNSYTAKEAGKNTTSTRKKVAAVVSTKIVLRFS